MNRFPNPNSCSQPKLSPSERAITSSANEIDSALHFDLWAIKDMVGEGNQTIVEVIARTRSELIRLSFALKTHIDNKDINGLNSIGHKLYQTTVSVGLNLLSKIVAEFEHMNIFNQEYADELFTKTKSEIEFVFDLKFH